MTTSDNNHDGFASPAKKRRGFATMDAAVVREFARRGGVAAHKSGRAHEFTSEEARVAGRKGGLVAHAKAEVAAREKVS
jgi:uncharacterized protein